MPYSRGPTRYQNYTMHKDYDRKNNYLSRHGKEDHSAKIIRSAAFMSAHLLWVNQHYRHQLVMSIENLILMLNLLSNV